VAGAQGGDDAAVVAFTDGFAAHQRGRRVQHLDIEVAGLGRRGAWCRRVALPSPLLQHKLDMWQ
jgi:hypothetical protein